MLDAVTRRLPGAGLISGPFAWGISTQLNYSLVTWVCDSGIPATVWIGLALAALSVLGGAVSLLAFRRDRRRLASETPAAGATVDMLAVLGMGAGGLFALVIAMQATAGLFLSGCER